jgi:HAD superfamily hydrolase (TIGR01549 family)
MIGKGKYRAVILDFDDVILESMGVKARAFANVFSGYPEYVDEIVHYHLENGGTSRFDKFRYIYSDILHKPLDEVQFQKLCADFKDAVYDQVLKCPFVPGATAFIKASQGKYDLFIVSATPEEEIRHIVSDLGLTSLFTGIYGSPVKKAEHILRIAQQNGYLIGDIVYIGDALSDYEAAQSAGCDFIGRRVPEEPDRFEGLDGVQAVIENLIDIEDHL